MITYCNHKWMNQWLESIMEEWLLLLEYFLFFVCFPSYWLSYLPMEKNQGLCFIRKLLWGMKMKKWYNWIRISLVGQWVLWSLLGAKKGQKFKNNAHQPKRRNNKNLFLVLISKHLSHRPHLENKNGQK